MTKNYLLFASIIYILLAGGCSYRQYSYINHLPHDPAFEKGGELTAGVSPGLYGFNAQASVSPVQYTGLTAGYTHDVGIGYGYNYGALLYMPLIKQENNKLFISFHYEQAEGTLDKRLTAIYKSTNLRSSIYGSFTRGSHKYKLGITAQFTSARYQQLFVQRDVVTVFSGSSTKVLADARNVNFTGNGLYGFFEINQNSISNVFYMGSMPHRHNFWQVGPAPVQDKSFKFSHTFFFMWSVRLRLKLY